MLQWSVKKSMSLLIKMMNMSITLEWWLRDIQLWEYTIRTWDNMQYVWSARIHNTYVREYSIRTESSVRITRYNTHCVRIFPRKWHKTIHSTYGFPCTNYTIRYIVRTEVSKFPRGPVWITRYVRTLNVRTRTVLVSNSTFCYYKKNAYNMLKVLIEPYYSALAASVLF